MSDSYKKSILIVDDEPDICVNLEEALCAEGYTTFVAHTGEKAIEIADREQVEIILLDIMMPGLDGYEVCRRLREKASTRRSSIVFASALKKTAEKVEGLDTGADDYITKPYDYDELLAKIRALFRLREYQNQLTRLIKFSHSINKISVEEIRESIKRFLPGVVPSDRFSLFIIDDTDNLLRLFVENHGADDMDQMTIHFSASPLMEQVLRTKENCLVDDFLGSSFYKGERREKYADNFALCIPLITGGEPIGALNFNGNSKGYFDKRDFVFAELTAEMIARSLRNARLMSEQKKLATQDGLTKLLNHRNFYEQLDIEFSRAKRFSHPLSVVMLDIDFFKKINDTYGHPAGDTILKEMAKRIKGELRSVDIVARYGGEEFGLVLPESDRKASMLVAERIRQKVCTSPFGIEKGEVNVTVSIGVCDSSAQAITDGADMMKKADKALYESKNNGRNRITLYSAGADN